MENFLSSLSSEGYSFGFRIEENEHGDLIVTQLLPGGPAWNSGVIHAGDVIQTLQWEGMDPIDVTNIDVDEMDAILKDANHSIVELTLSDVAGLRIKVKLKKERIAEEENIVKSFILDGKTKIGYISLPGFYSNWGNDLGSNCANDVAKEILKLKKENIEGIILDVRFNGGGSLHEAVAMAGIFIDVGPIGVLKDKKGELTTHKDMNRGTVYDGPLVLMVNSMSASASEFLAGALQDYHRAIIVGGQTFGKGTAQNIFPLDPLSKVDLAQAKVGAGFASVTTSKIYRVIGKTTQRHGITPDIEIPDLVSQFIISESEIPLALASDYIVKKVYYQPYDVLPIKKLKERSEIRINDNPQFKLIQQYSSWLGKTQKDDPISLKWIDFNKAFNDRHKIVAQLDTSLNRETSLFNVRSHTFGQKRMQMDEYINNSTKACIKKLKQDSSLEEAYNIICEFIAINENR
jgi:carboxyl-terminal processing protease